MADPVSEERRKAYVERARKGVLAWLAERDGAATTLAEMHEYRSAKFLLAHQGFPEMKESFVDEGLVEYDGGTGTATLTETGRTFIA